MEPLLERPGEDGDAQVRAARPSPQQLLLVLGILVGLFALSFAAAALIEGGGTAERPEEQEPEPLAEAISAEPAPGPAEAEEGGAGADEPYPGGLFDEVEGAGEAAREEPPAGEPAPGGTIGDDPGSEEPIGAEPEDRGGAWPDAGDGVSAGEEHAARELFETESGHDGEPVESAGFSARPGALDGPAADAPLLALVIDDWGYGWEAAADFLALDIPLTVAIIPYLPRSTEHARLAAGNGHEVILHLPMEPQNGAWELGEGAVTTAMSDDEIAFEVRRALDSLPYVSGINNHMGSKATQDERVVRAVLGVVKERGAFFLDSRTTPESLVDKVAAEMGVPHLANDRFIDLEPNAARVREAVLRAADTARRRGWAVAIGHVNRSTYQGIVEALPELRAKGVRLAYLSEVLAKARPDWEADRARLPASLP